MILTSSLSVKFWILYIIESPSLRIAAHWVGAGWNNIRTDGWGYWPDCEADFFWKQLPGPIVFSTETAGNFLLATDSEANAMLL